MFRAFVIDYRRAAFYVGTIMKEANLLICPLNKIQLVINLKTAKQIGLHGAT
jgi:hypothetical protein